MISKELFIEVYGEILDRFDSYDGRIIDIKQYLDDSIQVDYIMKGYSNSMINCYSINIYELAHKCKEWALDYVDNIGSGRDKSKLNVGWCICNNGEIQEYAKTEIEAIFKACQWILDNKDNN